MTQILDNELPVNMRFKAIELINSSIKQPENGNQSISNFNFNLSIESKIDAQKKFVFTIVHIEVQNADQTESLGNLSVSCIYEIENFEEIISIDAQGKVDIPKMLLETLNTISISTTRGVMFSTFKGTFLHGAILPIIDAKAFTIEN